MEKRKNNEEEEEEEFEYIEEQLITIKHTKNNT